MDSVASGLAAAAGGAHRLELCDGLVEGGLTPSLGKLRVLLSELAAAAAAAPPPRSPPIPVHVLLRPRGGDFCYDEQELAVVLADAAAAAEAGAAGLVFGALTAEGAVDERALAAVARAARGLPLTFHRALDMAAEPETALRAAARCAAVRYVLTSGGASSAAAGAPALRRLVAAAADAAAARGAPLDVIAAAGITPGNAAALLRASGVAQLHASARVPRDSAMRFRRAGVFMGGEKVNVDVGGGGGGGPTEYTTRVASAELVAGILAAARQADVLGT